MVFKLYSKEQDLEEAVFKAAMYWRIAYGTVRIVIGYKLLSLVGMPALEVYQRVLRSELAETHDVIFQVIGRMLAHHGFSITYFLAAYFLFWGIVDVLLSVSMLRHYLWAFPTSMLVIGAFIVYEIYRVMHTHSPILFGFILIDLFIVYLIFRERERLVVRIERKQAAVSA